MLEVSEGSMQTAAMDHYGLVAAICKDLKTAERAVVGYKMETSFRRNQEAINNTLNKKGRFILATNELDSESYKDEQILEKYKEKQNVEGGFRFLKDPWFMVDSIFLKLPRRIEALMMIMALRLMIYNVGQYRLRKQLKALYLISWARKYQTLP